MSGAAGSGGGPLFPLPPSFWGNPGIAGFSDVLLYPIHCVFQKQIISRLAMCFREGRGEWNEGVFSFMGVTTRSEGRSKV